MREKLRLRARDLEWREVQGEVVVLDVDRSLYLAANRTGAVLWSELARGATRDQLIDRLRVVFELDERTARRDVDSFLGELRDHQLLEG